MWKVGLVGAGYWSPRHLRAWSGIARVEVAALCDTDKEKLQEKAALFCVPERSLYTSFEEMLADEAIDIVDIVTGPGTHLELVTKAAAAGKHVMCQKPFAPSLEEAERMVEACEAAGVRLMVTENWRWLQPFQYIKAVLDSGALGPVTAVRYAHSDYYTPRMEPGVTLPQPVFRDMPKLLFYEMGVHWFDAWRFLFGTPQRLYAETSCVSPYIAGEDSGIVVLGHERFYGYMDMSWATRHKLETPLGEQVGPVHLEQLSIDGRDATLKLYTDGKMTLVSRNGAEETVLHPQTSLDHDESHVRLQTHFIRCLESGEPFQTEGRDNLTTLRMVFGVYESAASHLPISLAQEGDER